MEDNNIKNMTPEIEIVIDDGYLRIPIRNLYGDEVGVFKFNPTDLGMAGRYNEVVDKLPGIIEPLQHVNIKPDGTAEEGDVDAVKVLREATDNLYKVFDYLLGGNMSEAFFGRTNPFSPVKGYFYCERALIEIGKIIASQQDVELKKINKRLDRYTQGYTGKPNRAQRRRNKHRR